VNHPQIAVGSDGTTVAVWSEVVGGVSAIKSSTASGILGSWTTPKTASQSSLHSNYPKVAVDGSGNATAIWYEYTFSNNQYLSVNLMSSTLSKGASSWSTPVRIALDDGKYNPDQLEASVKADAAGNVLAIWANSTDGDFFSIQTAVKPYGSNWSQLFLATAGDLYSFSDSIAMASSGDAFMHYVQNSAGSVVVSSQETDTASFSSNQWSFPQQVSTSQNSGFPRVSASLNGTSFYAASTWLSFDGSHKIVQAIVGSKTIVIAPSNVLVSQSVQNFGVFQDYQNTLTWTASTDPSVTGYSIYRNGVFWTTTDASTLSVVDHNAVQNGAVTYGVAAFDGDQHQSAIITVNFP
jgi:hypothetical protein